MQTLLKKALTASLGLALLTLPASAGSSKSFTKSAAGISYKLTTPNPLPLGEQTLSLRLMKGASLVKGAKLSAVATMGDGMKAAVKVTPKPSGEFELKASFGMGGEWRLRIQQSAPVKAELSFDLMVAGGAHSGHQM